MQMSSFLLYTVGNKRSNVRQMFNPKKTVVKPTPLKHPRKLVVNKVIPEEHASSSAAAPSSFVNKANKARDTISTALASIKNLPAHDDRQGVPSSYRQEYTQSIRTLDRIIRREWNYTITTYLSAPESSRRSSPEASPAAFLHPRSPSPSPPRPSLSSDSVEF
jgi:hypothetical protein